MSLNKRSEVQTLFTPISQCLHLMIKSNNHGTHIISWNYIVHVSIYVELIIYRLLLKDFHHFIHGNNLGSIKHYWRQVTVLRIIVKIILEVSWNYFWQLLCGTVHFFTMQYCSWYFSLFTVHVTIHVWGIRFVITCLLCDTYYDDVILKFFVYFYFSNITIF